MRNKRLIIALLAAVVFGLVAAVSVSQYLARAQAYTKNLNNVVVAKVEIPVGSRIIAEHLTVLSGIHTCDGDGAADRIEHALEGLRPPLYRADADAARSRCRVRRSRSISASTWVTRAYACGVISIRARTSEDAANGRNQRR